MRIMTKITKKTKIEMKIKKTKKITIQKIYKRKMKIN
jgi:hypothetical protein